MADMQGIPWKALVTIVVTGVAAGCGGAAARMIRNRDLSGYMVMAFIILGLVLAAIAVTGFYAMIPVSDRGADFDVRVLFHSLVFGFGGVSVWLVLRGVAHAVIRWGKLEVKLDLVERDSGSGKDSAGGQR